MALNGEKGQSELSEDGLALMADILDSIRVVSIDSETSTQHIDDSSVKTDSCTYFCRQFHEELAKALPKGALGKPANEYAKRVKGGRRYDADMGEGRALCMIWYNQTQNFEISIMGDRKNILQAKASPVLEKYIGRVDEYECEGRSKFWLTRQHDGFSFNRFRDSPARDYIDDTVTLYETVCKAEKELAALKR